jgi:hypothetical protein
MSTADRPCSLRCWYGRNPSYAAIKVLGQEPAASGVALRSTALSGGSALLPLTNDIVETLVTTAGK